MGNSKLFYENNRYAELHGGNGLEIYAYAGVLCDRVSSDKCHAQGQDKVDTCSSTVTMMVSMVAQQKQIEEQRACKENARPFRLHELCRWEILKGRTGKDCIISIFRECFWKDTEGALMPTGKPHKSHNTTDSTHMNSLVVCNLIDTLRLLLATGK